MSTTNPFDRNKTKEAKLGEIIAKVGEQNQRDAVHIAVIPMLAADDLQPGEHVALLPGPEPRAYGVHVEEWRDGERRAKNGHGAIGIVDPFLVGYVKAGQYFWLCLYQGQVTTLRHAWTHPAIPDEGASPAQVGDDVAASAAWLRAYAHRVKPYDKPDEAFAELMSELGENRLHYNGKDLHSRGEVIDEFDLMHHASIVLGKRLDLGEFSFSCSC